jgi:hypothetical protein
MLVRQVATRFPGIIAIKLPIRLPMECSTGNGSRALALSIHSAILSVDVPIMLFLVDGEEIDVFITVNQYLYRIDYTVVAVFLHPFIVCLAKI